MERLSLTDAGFIYAETPNTPMAVASLQHFSLPTQYRDGGIGQFFHELKQYLRERAGHVAFMQRKLVQSPLGLDHPVWVTDRDFDINNHVRHIRLPEPQDMSALESLVAELHARPMDFDKPLWAYYFIDCGDNTFAWYTKTHHSGVDGMAGKALFELVFSADPDTVPPTATDRPQDSSDPFAMLFDSALSMLRAAWTPVSEAQTLSTAVAEVSKMAFEKEGLGALGQPAPQTRFNKSVGKDRVVSLGTLPLAEFKQVYKHFGVKLNDLFMTVCAGALRRYLAEENELPKQPLLAGAPVSLREAGDSSMNNQVTMMMSSLATDITDPLERLAAITASANRGKQVTAAMKPLARQEPRIIGMPWMVRSAVQMMDSLKLADVANPAMNVCISNVPGPMAPVYLNGAKMLSHYPISIATHGSGLNITVQSYCDDLFFNITACSKALPDAARLNQYMVDAWLELRDLSGLFEEEFAIAAA